MAAPAQTEDRNASIATIYDARALNHHESWHPGWAKRFLAIIDNPPLSPGNRIIDLGCGTGLITFVAAQQVAPGGHVYGLDISENMLEVARGQLRKLPERQAKTVHLMHVDVRDLSAVAEFVGYEDTFDLMTCCNALIEMDDRELAIARWAQFLKPFTGRLVLDVPHPHNQQSGNVLERVAKKMDLNFPFSRAWIHSEEDIRTLLNASGELEVEKIEYVEQGAGDQGVFGPTVQEARKAFNTLTEPGGSMHGWIKEHWDRLEHIRHAFIKEWAELAHENGGQMAQVDGVYVAVAVRQ